MVPALVPSSAGEESKVSEFCEQTLSLRVLLILSQHALGCSGLQGLAHPQPAPEDGDLASSLLLALPPLHQVEAIIDWQGDVPLAHCGVDSTSEQVGLSLQCHLHAIGQQQPQRAIGPDVVAVPDLV